MATHKIAMNLELNVTDEDIDDIMCSALEGSITYWCDCAKVVGDYLGEYASEQISRGGELKLHDAEEGKWYTLTLDKLLDGIKLAIMDGCYADYEWAIGGNLDCCQIDACVADCIVQYALFGEVVFG